MPATYVKCIVPGCGNNAKINPQQAFFHLPKTINILEKWARNMNLPDVLLKPESSRLHYKICRMHFDDSCFQTPEKKKLNRGVVPTIFNLERDLILQEEISPYQEDIPVRSDEISPTTLAVPGPSKNQVTSGPSQTAFGAEMGTVPLPTPHGSKNAGNRPYSILQLIGAKSVGELTPKKRKYHRELVKARHLISTMRRRGATCVKKLFQDPSDIFTNTYMKAMASIEQMPAVVQLFIRSQVRNVHKKSKARRYTADEKSFFLALQKSSPRGYNQLRKFFSLPSPRTLSRALEHVSLTSGINENLFSYLNENSIRRSKLDRYCTLLFDEVSLRPHLQYNKASQIIDGLETVSDERSYKIADHALVFMLRGLYKSWKQPIAFYFVQSTAKTFCLKKCIREVVTAVQEKTKFEIIASVSDMGSSNRSALRSLSEENGRPDDFIYKIQGREIIHIFDAPHLIKCLRNNFLTKDITFDGNKTAKWDHLKTLYDLEALNEDGKLTKLSKDHLEPEGKKKMKVSLAVQVFSRTVYAALTLLSNSGGIQAHDTAAFCLFVNNVFDSLNSSLIATRPLACRVNDRSVHNEFWAEAKVKLAALIFTKNGKKVAAPPCVRFSITTIRNMQALWSSLKVLGFKYLLTKFVNQDPLENFFAVIRGLCGQNVNPTCGQFVAAFKTSLINNTLKNCASSNCEDDGTVFLLALKSLLSASSEPACPNPASNEPFLAEPTPADRSQPTNQLYELCTKIRLNTSAYIAGFIGRKVLAHGCQACVAFYTTNTCTDSHAFIKLKDYGTNRRLLVYPTEEVIRMVDHIKPKIFHNIPQLLNQENIIQKLIDNNMEYYNINCPCDEHATALKLGIMKTLSYVMFTHFVKIVNKKLQKKDLRPNSAVDTYLRMYGRM